MKKSEQLAALQKNYSRIINMRSGLVDPRAKPVKGTPPKVEVARRETKRYPSLITNTPFNFDDTKVRYEGEMLKRELAAVEESEYKKTCVGVLVNKSSYQYITPGMDLTTLGRK